MLVLLCSGHLALSQNFITQWNLATAGSGPTQLSFGTATSGVVNYTWQELSPGSASGSGSWSGSTLTITGLPTGSTIRLQIAPANFQRININNGSERNRLTQVENWGSTTWTSMQNAFYGCANLQVTATDAPNFTGVTNMSQMFRGCTNLNSPGNINTWNTGSVTNMSSMFEQATAFNQNIGSWNTWSVTNMSFMFAGASAFNQNIGTWNTGAVNNMSSMFGDASAFNQNIGSWNTGAVTTMSSMFVRAIAFNQNIDAWNTGAVTNMAFMFDQATVFNQNIGSWNTGAVTTMRFMFQLASAFNQNIGSWNTSSVNDMSSMFRQASAFNQNIGLWNTGAITSMDQMFIAASAFNQNIGSWNTGAVTRMFAMFSGASAFNQNIGSWTLNAGVDLASMLNNCGMDCNNYSATLIGWSANPSSPNGLFLGATGKQYGTNAVAARTNLVSTKSWTITGDTPSGSLCNSGPVPTITSFSPASGPIGTTVTISGTNFSSTPSNNIVYFGSVKVTVTSATPTQLVVTVPGGLNYKPISVNVGGLTGFSRKPFISTFSGGPISSNAFSCLASFLSGFPDDQEGAVGDIDGDGKPDLSMITDYTGNTIQVRKNVSSPAFLNASSFESAISFNNSFFDVGVDLHDIDGDGKLDLISDSRVLRNTSTLGSITTTSFSSPISFGGPGSYKVESGDIDGDGKIDIVALDYFVNRVAVIKNNASPGAISPASFSAPVYFSTVGLYPSDIKLADLDGDTKPEIIIICDGSSINTLSIFRNTTASGAINSSSFAARLDFTTGNDPASVVIGDLNNDGNEDIVVANSGNNTLSVFQNLSTIGTISLASPITIDPGIKPLDIEVGDLDGDGKLELIAANAGDPGLPNGTISVMKNIHSSGVIDITSFSPKIDVYQGLRPSEVKICDIDGEGRLDIIIRGGAILLNKNGDPGLSISSFTPISGPSGTSVTITGTEFDATPAANIVSFNGITASVTSASPTSLVVIVPSSATTGVVTITVACKVVTGGIFTIGSSVITITSHPVNRIVCDGSTTTFSVSATGPGVISYQWQKDAVDIVNGTGYSGVTTNTLTLSTTGTFGVGSYRCRISSSIASSINSNNATLTLNSVPNTPTVFGSSSCDAASLTLNVSGGTNGQYRWYTTASGGTAITGEVNATYITPLITATTTYYVSIDDGICESGRTPVIATINSSPPKPTIISSITPTGGNVSVCSSNILTLSAPAGFSLYAWSNGETTQQITIVSSGSYSVVVTNSSGCSSPTSDPLMVTVIPAPCANQAPIITASQTSVPIAGTASIDLSLLISDTDNNIDLGSLKILIPPSSGAVAEIVNSTLSIDYAGLNFSGQDKITIEVCDLLGSCTQQELTINVVGDLIIYTGISPNSDLYNEKWIIQNIESLPDTKENKVSIYNRWGDLVFEISNYDNNTRVFKGINKNGNEVTSGVYFYRIEFASGKENLTGYLTIKK